MTDLEDSMAIQQYRYLTALPQADQQIFLAWRLLASDLPQTAFQIAYRQGDGDPWQPATTQPIADSTNALIKLSQPTTYQFRVVAGGNLASEIATVDAGAEATNLALDLPLDPADQPAGLVVGDLENDGRLGYVMTTKRQGTVWVVAYSHQGRLLWERNTNLPDRGGWDGSAHHVPILCWDLNGDGRTEVAFHSYLGTFPTDFYDQRLDEGECLTSVDGETGDLVWTSPWPARKSRVMMTVGHLRGLDQPASVVVLDETYGDVTLTAIDGQTGVQTWQVDQARPAGHNLDIADIDGDGRQEIICGGVCYNGDGTIRWQAEPFGHTDLSKPAKIDPARPGLQIWYAVEKDNPGVYLVDQNGKTIFKHAFRHAHFGWIARHAPDVPGLHPHTAEDARSEYGAEKAGMRQAERNPIFLPDGTIWLNLSEWQRKNFVPVHWAEGSTVSFIIRKENKRVVRLLADGQIEELTGGKLPEGGLYGRNLACVDVLGDYRENIITFDQARHRLMVLVNTALAHSRGYSPWDDFAYRHDRSQLGSGYYIYLSPPDTRIR
jgi:outer membrane protein assembly factor BamB